MGIEASLSPSCQCQQHTQRNKDTCTGPLLQHTTCCCTRPPIRSCSWATRSKRHGWGPHELQALQAEANTLTGIYPW